MTNNKQYDKPFKTYDEQIEHLKSIYKLEIKNNKFAKYALSTFSYYDLINGYKELFMVNDEFREGTTIEYLMYFYLYDKEFQNLIFRYSLFIENSFKTKLAYILSEDFGVEQKDYLANKNYNYSYKNKIFLHEVKKDILKHCSTLDNDGNRVYFQQPSKHYALHHNHIPAWILFKNITFADAISLYKLLKKEQKQKMSDAMLSYNIPINDKTAFLIPALDLIRNYRNVIAHNLKFVTYTCPKYGLPFNITKKIINDETVLNGHKKLYDLYACIIAIYVMIDNPFMQAMFFNDIAKIRNFNKLQIMGTKNMFDKISDDYLEIINVKNIFSNFLLYVANALPIKHPFYE